MNWVNAKLEINKLERKSNFNVYCIFLALHFTHESENRRYVDTFGCNETLFLFDFLLRLPFGNAIEVQNIES